jgi:F0F1-type ATP synthase assembly protein I
MKTPDKRAGATWLRYTHLGLQYCLTLLLFVFGGRWLDQRLETDPLWTIVGALLGFGAATYTIVRQALLIRD